MITLSSSKRTERRPNFNKNCLPPLLLSNYREVQEILLFTHRRIVIFLGSTSFKKLTFLGDRIFFLSGRIFLLG
jgi:hypothetical protein